MNRPSFDHTVSILVKAYLNDTLEHGKCEACAVGNIVHAAGFPRYNTGECEAMKPDSCGNWKGVFVTTGGIQKMRHAVDKDWEQIGLRMIEATGYTVEELAWVEYAFETAPKGKSDDDWMLNGLMTVVDVLASIHNVDLSTKEQAKLLFVK